MEAAPTQQCSAALRLTSKELTFQVCLQVFRVDGTLPEAAAVLRQCMPPLPLGPQKRREGQCLKVVCG